MFQGSEATGSDPTATPPPKAKKGRKSKSALVPPAPEGGLVSSKPASETSSTNGEVMNMNRVDTNELDNISVLSLDEGELNFMAENCPNKCRLWLRRVITFTLLLLLLLLFLFLILLPLLAVVAVAVELRASKAFYIVHFKSVTLLITDQ